MASAGMHDPIQRVEFMNAPKLNPLKRWYNFHHHHHHHHHLFTHIKKYPCTPTLRTTMHSVTDRQTYRRTDGQADDMMMPIADHKFIAIGLLCRL